jgi:diguanylate cyclase (GGDEF)-like protein
MDLRPHDSARRSPAGWALWRLPARLLGTVLLVEAVAAGLLVHGLVDGRAPTPEDARLALVLCLLAVAHTEVAVRVERARRHLTEAGHGDLSSVWTFAGALLLPGAFAALVAVLVLAHLWLRAGRPDVPPHRQVFDAAATALACVVTAGLVEFLDPGPVDHDLWVLPVAMLVFGALHTGPAAAVAVLSPPRAAPSAFIAAWDENLLGFGLLCLGALTAIALSVNPWLVLFVLPPVLALLRTVLIRPLVSAASTDGKTGLLNAATWNAEAERTLRRPGGRRACGVLVLDLDHFKAVNDTHGHVVGDRVLAAVADALRAGVRAHDLVGRLGGEEFVVMPLAAAFGTRSVELEVVAERIRARVAALRVEVATPDGPFVISDLSVSVGGAVSPLADADLASLLHAADLALYAAKGAGRNRVRIEVTPPVQPGRVPLPGDGGRSGPGDGGPGDDGPVTAER